MYRHLVLGVAMAIGFSGVAFAATATDTPEKAANAFYRVYMKSNKDGIPDAKGRAKFHPFISAALDKLLADGDKAEDAHYKATKNEEPPLVEGDLFTSNFEGTTSFKLGACKTVAKTSQCPAALVYDVKSENSKDTPAKWTDTVFLVMETGGWRVDDIAYGATWDFGNKGKLSDVLKDVVKEGKEYAK
jgi:hypothetical protein